MKIYLAKNSNAYVSFEKLEGSQLWYIVRLYDTTGQLLDKVRCDNYKNSLAYLKSFRLIMKGL